MPLKPCHECNKEISTKAIICPQCGAPQNPVSDLVDKAKKVNVSSLLDKAKEPFRFLRKYFVVIFIFIFIFIFICFIFYFFWGTLPPEELKKMHDG
jgi:uncharacterized membrane protein YvbJ